MPAGDVLTLPTDSGAHRLGSLRKAGVVCVDVPIRCPFSAIRAAANGSAQFCKGVRPP